MKNFYIFLTVLLTNASLLAQQVKPHLQKDKRVVYKNQLAPHQMNNQKKNSIYDYGQSDKKLMKKKYAYQEFLNAEIFIQVLNPGYYTVEIDNQLVSNPYGKFRFFDLYPGSQLLSIYHNGFLIFQTTVEPIADARMYLNFKQGDGLFLMDIQPLKNYNDMGNYPLGFNPIGDKEFNQLIYQMKNHASFDDDKMELIEIKINTNALFTTNQIRQILKLFSFDDKRLEVAERLMNYCVDFENYYLLENEFAFSSNKEKFRKLLLN